MANLLLQLVKPLLPRTVGRDGEEPGEDLREVLKVDVRGNADHGPILAL